MGYWVFGISQHSDFQLVDLIPGTQYLLLPYLKISIAEFNSKTTPFIIQIGDIDNKFADLNNKITELNSKIAESIINITDLNIKTTDFNINIADLNNEFADIDVEIGDMNNKITDLTIRIIDLNNEVAYVTGVHPRYKYGCAEKHILNVSFLRSHL